MVTYVIAFFTAALISFVLAPLLRDHAQKLQLIDSPSEERKIHADPIPRTGGVAIFLGFIVAITIPAFLNNPIANIFHDQFPMVIALLLPCFLMFLLGLVDDIWHLKAPTKLSYQILIAVVCFSTTVRITTIFNPFEGANIILGGLALPITICWLVGITNAFNLIDGMDGLSAGSALFATLSMILVALIQDHILVAVLACALAGAIIGFLKYNFNPATVFMGDSGSLFIGFLLAAMAVHGAQKSATVVAIAIPMVSFGLPILETLLSMARRFLAGQSIFTADRRHIHHQLLAKGFSHKKVVIVLYGVSALYALLSLLMIDSSMQWMGVVFLIFGFSAWLGLQHLGYYEFGEVGRLFYKSLRQRKVIIHNVQIHNTIENMATAETLTNLLEHLGKCSEVLQFRCMTLQLPAAVFPGFEAMDPFKSYQEEESLIIVWVGEKETKQSVSDGDMIEIYIPLRFYPNRGAITFGHNFQGNLLLFDINLLFNNLRTNIEQAIKRIGKFSDEGKSDTLGPLVNRRLPAVVARAIAENEIGS
jgi:UDP-GlcNAc:undecaprenyl-phosphate GlcNAc-1-phosphate transferase